MPGALVNCHCYGMKFTCSSQPRAETLSESMITYLFPWISTIPRRHPSKKLWAPCHDLKHAHPKLSTPGKPQPQQHPAASLGKRRRKKKRRKTRSNPLGQPTLFWEDQDLPLMLSCLYPLHLQVRTQGKPRSLVSAHSTATASPSQPGLAGASSQPCRTQGCRW